MKLTPAVLTFDADGTPFSPIYGDVYHSSDSGPGQSRHVFLSGNDLPSRWAGKQSFTIVETGFGLGLNFLATWHTWHGDPARCGRLHFVSIEKHPFASDALAAAHERYPEFARLAAQLHAAWPTLVPGTHRLHLAEGRVVLTLVFMDAVDALGQLRFGVDAFFLDGFAPALNGDMWTPALMKSLARLARPAATLATYTAARSVRDALVAAGFVVTKRPGFGRKRDMLSASYLPRWQPRHAPPVVPRWQRRHAIVIGAGLAGAAVSERLAARGWEIDLIERKSQPHAQTSSAHAAIFQPHLSRDDAVISRLARAGFLYSIDYWRSLRAAGLAPTWRPCGVLQIARNAADEARMAQIVASHAYPPTYAQFLTKADASLHAGCEVSAGGWWFSQGGWIKPASLVSAQLSAANCRSGRESLRTHFDTYAYALRREGEFWHAMGSDGDLIAAAPVLVANASDAARLAPVAQSLQCIRGQVTHLPEHIVATLRAVVSGRGYVVPAVDGIALTGPTYDFNDDDAMPREAGHAHNLAQLTAMLHAPHLDVDPASVEGSVGFRCVAPDRLPLIGALPDIRMACTHGARLRGAHAADLPRVDGLYGAFAYASRGLVWAALGGEMIASQLEGEPPPLTNDLLDAIDPARFVVKLLRRGTLDVATQLRSA